MCLHKNPRPSHDQLAISNYNNWTKDHRRLLL